MRASNVLLAKNARSVLVGTLCGSWRCFCYFIGFRYRWISESEYIFCLIFQQTSGCAEWTSRVIPRRKGKVIPLQARCDPEALEGGEWSAARPGLTLPRGKDPVPILQEAGWTPGPVWKSRPHRDSFPDRPVRSQSLHRLSYPAHDATS